VYISCQRAMGRYAVLDLRVATHHDFDKVAERQEPLKTHGLLKEAICPQRQRFRPIGRLDGGGHDDDGEPCTPGAGPETLHERSAMPYAVHHPSRSLMSRMLLPAPTLIVSRRRAASP
jgi:hypothetical protein